MQSKPTENEKEVKATYTMENKPVKEPKLKISKNELWGWTILMFATLALTCGLLFGILGAIVTHLMLRLGKSQLVSVCVANLITIAMFIITWGLIL